MSLDLPLRLAQRLKQPLPRRRAWQRYEPELSFGRHAGPAPASARPAAVMILLYPGEANSATRLEWSLPLTLRPDHLADHAGQVSLPGGSIDYGETPEQAALRELEEELACAAEDIELLGRLSELYVFVTHFRVTPVIGWLPRRPILVPSVGEVAEVLELPLANLYDDAPPTRVARHLGPMAYTVPALPVGPHAVWGATAMILGELAAVIAEAI